jgi:toxin ParE1/3/4
MRVRYAVPAQADLGEIYSYIADNNPAAAERVTRQIKADAELLGEFPHIARASDLPGLRVRKVRQYPYLIFYAVRGDEAWIIRIRHGARRPLRAASQTD